MGSKLTVLWRLVSDFRSMSTESRKVLLIVSYFLFRAYAISFLRLETAAQDNFKLFSFCRSYVSFPYCMTQWSTECHEHATDTVHLTWHSTTCAHASPSWQLSATIILVSAVPLLPRQLFLSRRFHLGVLFSLPSTLWEKDKQQL